MIDDCKTHRRGPCGPDLGPESGFALVVVLWIVASAALLVAAFSATTRSGVMLAGSELQLAQTAALLHAGLEIAAGRLADEVEERKWAGDGQTHTVAFAGSEILIRIEDPNGRIDLNKAAGELLLGLLKRYTVSEADATALRDRIIAERTPADAGEKASRTNEPVPVSEPQLPFIEVAQLRRIEGITPALMTSLGPFLTVYSRSGRINPAVAPDEVLGAVPDITPADFNALRIASSARDNARPDGSARAAEFLSDDKGPAYKVMVEVRTPTQRQAVRKAFIIVMGLDDEAPYRLLAEQPVR